MERCPVARARPRARASPRGDKAKDRRPKGRAKAARGKAKAKIGTIMEADAAREMAHRNHHEEDHLQGR